jgi:hypothetical protein
MSSLDGLERNETAPNRLSFGEYTDRAGASEIKARIEAYWRARGYDVQVKLVDASSPALRAARTDVRSDLIDGLPRGAVRTRN